MPTPTAPAATGPDAEPSAGPGDQAPPAGARRLSPRERQHLGAMGAVILALHVLGWGIFVFAVMPLHDRALGIGVALTAYTLGLRHAFDADHIAAIDNTTRMLMARRQRPLSVGFWFSLGHSSVVFVMGVGLTLAAKAVFHAVSSPTSPLESLGGVIGASISGTFLYAIAAVNLVILAGLVRAFVRMRRGVYDEAELDRQLASRGMMNRFFGRLLTSISRPVRMYPVGVLFGLGFDTATEVALLAATAGAAESQLPWYAVLALPLLFAAGMTLLDTFDGTFMNVAYGWAFSRPVRKAYYNIIITGLSVTVAFVIGSAELLALIAQKAGLDGGLWSVVSHFDLNAAGVVIVGLFVATWVAAFAVWRFGRIESRWQQASNARRQAVAAAEAPD